MRKLGITFFILWMGYLTISARTVQAQGVLLRAVSTVNEGMGGTATATPVDSVGALYWNPATISAFEKSDMSFGSSIILANSTVESSFMGMKGSTDSNSGSVPAPYMGMILKDKDSRFTYGFGLVSTGGAQSNYAADSSNPILNQKYGIGRTSAKVEIFEMLPTASYQVTDRLSASISPTILMGRMIAEPLFFGPSSAEGRWSSGAGTRYIWGGGFQAGLYYKAANHFNWGLCYKSPMWCEKCSYQLSFNGSDSQTALFKMTVPAIYTLGFSYDGIEKTVLGIDLRYFDYSNAEGLSGMGYKPDGSIIGLGWQSVFALSIGAQRQINDNITVRCGYSFNQNPIPTEASYLNVPCPIMIQHGLHLGASYMFRNDWFLNLSYAHMFESSVSGALPQWSKIDPNSYVKNYASADAISFGVNKMF